MKKQGILNSDISCVLSNMGHTDTICIADCGLPIPQEIKKIDLALKFGSPSFIDVLKEIVNDFKVEAIVLAEEIKEKNLSLHDEILTMFPLIKVTYVPHSSFKNETKNCKAIIRTGEIRAYANIILQSACIF